MGPTGIFLCILGLASAYGWKNEYGSFEDNTTAPATRQLLDFKRRHPKPIGLLTVGSGAPVEIRDMISINSDLFRDELFFDAQTHLGGERIPERYVQSKGVAAWGYFQVTHDVSKYTKADVFNHIGKKTPVLARGAVGAPGRFGTDLFRDIKSLSTKFYTKDGILDFLNLDVPVFTTKDPLLFPTFVHTFRRNPASNLFDQTMIWDSVTLRPESLTVYLFLQSDFGIPDGWRHSDFSPLHTYEINNKHGERWYVRFHYRTEQGRKFLTTQEAAQIQSTDLDYFVRDLYNSIGNGSYPSWRLEMDVLSIHDIQTVDFNPFDITRLWKNGTYHTVPIGRLTLNRNSDNQFRDMEMAAFNPSNLVPGIPGPVDTLFRARRLAYRDTQNHRLGRNHLKIGVNAPWYEKSYKRDGYSPVWDNSRDAPNYFPNSYSGPVPLVDDTRPQEFLQITQTNAVDLEEPANFYNHILGGEGPKRRLAANLAATLPQTTEPTRSRVLKLLSLTDKDLYRRVLNNYKAMTGMSG